jgi:hypothetical protein
MRPQPRMEVKKPYECSHHGYTGFARHSPRDGFNGFLRSLPGDRALLPPSSARCESILADLIPASGYQDATTSPSADRALVRRALRIHRIPRSTLMTCATPLLSRRDAARNAADLRMRSTATDWHDGQISRSREKDVKEIFAVICERRREKNAVIARSNATKQSSLFPPQEPSSPRKSAKRVFALDVAVIHVLLSLFGDKDVDGRDKPGQARP